MMVLIAGLLFASSLYDQAVARVLSQRFGSVEYVVLNARTGATVATNWRDVSEPIPVGSLTKPFLAAELPSDRHLACERSCWLARGHGSIGLREAIAFSCNQYFLQSQVFAPTRLPAAPAVADVATLIGLSGDFRVAPLAVAQGYIRLTREVESVRDGMRLAVRRGTARAVNADALAKTGTARCAHSPHGQGDGLVVVLWPSTDPDWLLLMRVHGTTGAAAAQTAGRMVRVVSDAR